MNNQTPEPEPINGKLTLKLKANITAEGRVAPPDTAEADAASADGTEGPDVG